MSEHPEQTIDPSSPTIVEDIRRKIADKAAVVRGETWEAMGCPQSKQHMTEEQYRRDFAGRMWFCNPQVAADAQRALQIILCPKCREETNYGAVTATRFYITIEDDVMTVFPAIGHFLCHHCGFEEYHPLNRDPRVSNLSGQASSDTADALRYQQEMMRRQAAMQNNPNQLIGGPLNNAAAGGLANALGSGIAKGMGPIWGMTEDEKAKLHNLYQKTQAAVAPPPPIVQSREEAEMLLKLAPIERRQAIIQKLRDRGLI